MENPGIILLTGAFFEDFKLHKRTAPQWTKEKDRSLKTGSCGEISSTGRGPKGREIGPESKNNSSPN